MISGFSDAEIASWLCSSVVSTRGLSPFRSAAMQGLEYLRRLRVNLAVFDVKDLVPDEPGPIMGNHGISNILETCGDIPSGFI